MQLTEQQRAELERLGWDADQLMPRRTRWTKSNSDYDYADIDVTDGKVTDVQASYLPFVLEFAAILGIAPPGYRLVPEEVAERGLRHIASVRREAQNYLDVCEVRADEPDQSDETKETWARIVEEARQSLAEIDALASALQGEEGEKR